jgi:hypothetical protein
MVKNDTNINRFDDLQRKKIFKTEIEGFNLQKRIIL